MVDTLNTPLQLTLIRLIVSPLILPVLLVVLLPFNYAVLNGILACLFLVLSATDFFDGYLARKYDQTTRLGAILDPIADKFLLYATLIALVAAGKFLFYWAILLIGREFFIMALRTVALENNVFLVVSRLGKIKTAVLTAMIAWIIMNPYHTMSYAEAPYYNGIESALIASGLLLSIGSAWQYYRTFCIHVPTLFE